MTIFDTRDPGTNFPGHKMVTIYVSGRTLQECNDMLTGYLGDRAHLFTMDYFATIGSGMFMFRTSVVSRDEEFLADLVKNCRHLDDNRWLPLTK